MSETDDSPAVDGEPLAHTRKGPRRRNDEVRWRALVWAVIGAYVIAGALAAGVFRFAQVANDNSKAVARGTCVLVNTLENAAEREDAIVRNNPNLPTTKDHAKSRDGTRKLANDLRKEVKCPPRVPVPVLEPSSTASDG